ncbi:MAG TPA: Wzz/FepE/Etk N-terminal domain-containing protein, partial [Chloroflexota bacterium]|nr:Wzz/FepE/Etk N-terminal domain-containing protein [Chloroflexota bacterium]
MMELKHYLSTILKWWWLIALSTAVAAAFSYYASAQSPRIYQTATTLMVGQALQSPNPDNIQVYAATQLAQTYVQIVRRQPVMQAVVDDLQLAISWEQVAAQTSVALIQGTQLIEIKFVDTNPQRAKL